MAAVKKKHKDPIPGLRAELNKVKQQLAGKSPVNLLAGQVDTNSIQAGAITTLTIAANAVTTTELAADSVTSAKIAANTITAGDIAASTITGDRIAATTITATNIASGTITATQIAAGTITASVIAAGTITSTQIQAGSINSDRLYSGVVAAQRIQANNIAANVITAAEIAANTITATQLAASAVTTTVLAADSVTSAKIAANTITAGDIAAATITTNEIASGTIVAGNIAAGTITATQIAASTITGSLIAGSTITGSLIASATIDSTKLSVSQLAAISADMGSINAGTITGATFRTSAGTARVQIDSTAIFSKDTGGADTFRIDAATGNVTLKGTITSGSTLPAGIVTSATILDGTVTGTDVAAATLTGSNLVANTITASQIAANTITASQIAANTITASQMAVGSVTATVLAAGSVTADRLAIGQPVVVNVRNGNFAEANPADASALGNGWTLGGTTGLTVQTDTTIGRTAQLSAPGGASYAVQAVALPVGRHVFRVWCKTASFTSNAQLDATTGAKGGLVAGTATATVTSSTTQTGTVDWTLIEAVVNVTVAGTVNVFFGSTGSGTGTAQFGNLTAAPSISNTTLAPDSVTTDKILANTIVAADIAAATITGTQIAATTITAGNIASGTITATQISSGTITATQLSATAIDSMTVTGALIRTAASGARAALEGSGNRFAIYDSGGNAQVTMDGTDGLVLTGFDGTAVSAIPAFVPSSIKTVEWKKSSTMFSRMYAAYRDAPSGADSIEAHTVIESKALTGRTTKSANVWIDALTSGGTVAAEIQLGAADASRGAILLSAYSPSHTNQTQIDIEGDSSGYIKVKAGGSAQTTLIDANGDMTIARNLTVTGTTNVIPVPSWTAPSYSNNWRAYNADSSYASRGYYKDALGIVHLEGLLDKSGNNWAGGDLMFTVPAGFRPGKNLKFLAHCLGGSSYGYAQVSVQTNGNVSVGDFGGPANPVVWLSLSQISWKAEA